MIFHIQFNQPQRNKTVFIYTQRFWNFLPADFYRTRALANHKNTNAFQKCLRQLGCVNSNEKFLPALDVVRSKGSEVFLPPTCEVGLEPPHYVWAALYYKLCYVSTCMSLYSCPFLKKKIAQVVQYIGSSLKCSGGPDAKEHRLEGVSSPSFLSGGLF